MLRLQLATRFLFRAVSITRLTDGDAHEIGTAHIHTGGIEESSISSQIHGKTISYAFKIDTAKDSTEKNRQQQHQQKQSGFVNCIPFIVTCKIYCHTHHNKYYCVQQISFGRNIKLLCPVLFIRVYFLEQKKLVDFVH